MKTARLTNHSLHWLWLLAAAVLLGFWCWFNGYPFFYPDTGAYIKGGFTGIPGSSRPLTYGLFLRHTSMRDSLLWVVLAQGILTAIFIAWWLRQFSPKLTPSIFIGWVVFLVFCTHASYYVSYLLADSFTPIFFGCIILLLTAQLQRWTLVGVCLLYWLASMMHYSHLIAGMALAGTLSLGMLVLPRLREWLTWKKLGMLWLLVVTSWVGILLIHRISGGKWTLMRASHVYTVARLNETGILKQYLDKACPTGKGWSLCSYKDSLPADFLWDTKRSPVYLTGGWDANKPEYDAMLKDIVTTPKCLKRMLIESLNGGVKQFFNFRTETLNRNQEGSMLYNMVKAYFPNELHAFRYAKQNSKQEQLPIEDMNARQLFFFFAALVVAVLLASSPSWKRTVPVAFQRAFFLLLFCLIVNAFISSTFSTVSARFQGRLVWLFILSAGLATAWRAREFSVRQFAVGSH